MVDAKEQLDDELVLLIVDAAGKLIIKNEALRQALRSYGHALDASECVITLFKTLALITDLSVDEGQEDIYIEAGNCQRILAEETDMLDKIQAVEAYRNAESFNVYYAMQGYDCVFHTLAAVGELAKKRLNLT